MDELNNQVQSFSFDSITKQKIYDYIYSIKTCPYTNFDNFKYEVSSIFHTISKDLLDILMDFRWNRNTPGFMVLRNLPQDINIPFTPIDGNRSINKETFISEACLVGISQFIGEIFSYQQEKNGDLVHNICPVKT
ncbi:hypothetical protein H0W32_02480, partial [Patescibacteria group bacterium]|nr:hypothetical protein [Patescibacteria group bacterium]